MDLKQAKIDGTDILGSGISGILYTRKDWRKLTVNDQSVDNDGTDGRIVSDTWARTRVITFEGVIDRLGNADEQACVEHLEQIFQLHNGIERGKRLLYIKDMYDKERQILVKVKEPIDIQEYDDGFRGAGWRWRVVLESLDDPLYYGATPMIVNGIESEGGGFTIDFEIDFAMDEWTNIIECETEGTRKNAAKFTITVVNDIDSPLTIRDLTKGNFFSLDINAVAGDVIVIDTNTFTATKNGSNVLAYRVAESVWPYVQGVTHFVVEDVEGAIPEQDFNISVEFRNSLL